MKLLFLVLWPCTRIKVTNKQNKKSRKKNILYNLKNAAHDQHKFPSFQAITIKVFPHRRLWYWFVAGRKRNVCVHNRNSNFIVYSCMVKCETLLPAFSTIYELENMHYEIKTNRTKQEPTTTNSHYSSPNTYLSILHCLS